jgi:DNA-binding PadR family transcriptional regulator
MNDDLSRELTQLEYLILGIISVEARTGYDIMTVLEQAGNALSASPGSIYPALKRLEKARLIEGRIEVIRETRPRKLYAITVQGEAILDRWIRTPSPLMGSRAEFEAMLAQFIFTANRLTRAETLEWLHSCEQALETYHEARRTFLEILKASAPLHQQLVFEAKTMEFDMQRAWLEQARTRLQSAAQSETAAAVI